MGTRGPLKLPAHLRPVKDGEKSRSVADSVSPAAPQRPTSTDAEQLWDEIVPTLDEAGLVARCDGPTLDLMLEHYRLAKLAASQIESVTTEDHHNGDVKKHPAEAVFRLESAMFLQYAQQVGMSFASRARIPDEGRSADGDSNPFTTASG